MSCFASEKKYKNVKTRESDCNRTVHYNKMLIVEIIEIIVKLKLKLF